MAKHRHHMPPVCDLLYKINVDIPIATSGNAMAYNFNLLCLQRMFLCSSRRHWYTTDINSVEVYIVYDIPPLKRYIRILGETRELSHTWDMSTLFI